MIMAGYFDVLNRLDFGFAGYFALYKRQCFFKQCFFSVLFEVDYGHAVNWQEMRRSRYAEQSIVL